MNLDELKDKVHQLESSNDYLEFKIEMLQDEIEDLKERVRSDKSHGYF